LIKLFSYRDDLYLYGLILYLSLFGSHLLYSHNWIFIVFSLLFINWKKIYCFENILIFSFIVSLYGVYVYSHSAIFDDFSWLMGTISEIIMISLIYMVGLSAVDSARNNNKIDERVLFYILFGFLRVLFYILFGFFIAYCIGILYSYMFLPQNNPLSQYGFRVFYADHGAHIHPDGQIAVTIVAYFLSFTVALIPFFLFKYTELRKKKFLYMEIFLILSIGIFSLYLAIWMGRRMTILILIISFTYFGILFLISSIRTYKWHVSICTALIILMIAFLTYLYIKDSYVMTRIEGYNGFSDPRYNYWILGLQYMWQYPFGGAGSFPVVPNGDPSSHNFWINIGKHYGVPAFIASVTLYLYHLKYLVSIIRSKLISPFMKNIILIIAFVLFANMFVESIFHTEKILFFYSIFFLGFLKSYADFYRDYKQDIV